MSGEPTPQLDAAQQEQLAAYANAIQQQLQQQYDERLAQALATIQARTDAANVLTHPTGNMFYNPRPPVDPETFSGDSKSDPAKWLFSVDIYFEAANLDPAKYLRYAATLLRDGALIWWHSERNKGTAPTTYEGFKTELIKAFECSNPVKNARDRIADLKQTGPVLKYTSAFRNLCLEIPDMNEAEMLDRYVRGLKDRVRQELTIREPSTFNAAAAMAERYDRATFAVRVNTNTNTNSDRVAVSSRPTYASAATPMDLGAVQDAAAAKPAYTKLTPELRAQLIKEGKCLYCRKHGHMALSCPNKPPRNSPN